VTPGWAWRYSSNATDILIADRDVLAATDSCRQAERIERQTTRLLKLINVNNRKREMYGTRSFATFDGTQHLSMCESTEGGSEVERVCCGACSAL
jgi:hypothetical protein